MKNKRLYTSFLLILLVAATTVLFAQESEKKAALSGAWQLEDVPDEHVLIFTDSYFSYAQYQKASKQFLVTFGGTYKLTNGELVATLEFHSGEKDAVGTSTTYPLERSNDGLTITVNGEKTTWNRIDDGKTPLAGNWRITHRKQDGSLQAIHQEGARKTVKILSGSRFQWIAINTDTKEFFGTGGGTYTFQNGKYTETIDFFSRDSSRVGASLTFDGKLDAKGWHHSGLSSRGEPIYEIWNKSK